MRILDKGSRFDLGALFCCNAVASSPPLPVPWLKIISMSKKRALFYDFQNVILVNINFYDDMSNFMRKNKIKTITG